jgi:hypothetical protein
MKVFALTFAYNDAFFLPHGYLSEAPEPTIQMISRSWLGD